MTTKELKGTWEKSVFNTKESSKGKTEERKENNMKHIEKRAKLRW